VSDALTVDVNHGELHSLDLPETFETSESFDVVLVNHGEATHVHLHLDDSLSELAAIDAPNHHLKRDSERRVRVTLTADGTARGNLKVVTAYGATTRYIDLIVTEPTQTVETVEVGEELSKPKPRDDASTTPDVSTLALVAGGLMVLALAIGTAAVFQNIVILLAVILVAVSGLVAAVVLRRLG